MAQQGCQVTCYNRAGHHVSGAEYHDAGKTEHEGIRQKSVPTIERRGLAAVSSSAFAALYSAFGKYDVVQDVYKRQVMEMATKAIGAANGCGVPTIKPWNIDTIKEKMAEACLLYTSRCV